MRPQFYDPVCARAEHRSVRVSPLHSQPVLELYLSIPPDLHFLHGHDRGLVRTAFAPEVPEEILQRQWKDRSGNSRSELVFRNLAFLRSLLLDGTLVRWCAKATSADPAIASIPVGGRFRWANTEACVRMLEQGFGLQVERAGDKIYLRGQ